MNASASKPVAKTPKRGERRSGAREGSGQRIPAGFEQRLLARGRAAGFGRGDHLVIAFSGGRDSLGLAAALRRARDVLGVRLLLVHVDHRLRVGSGEEAERAAGLAAALGLELRNLAVAAPPTEIHPHVGIEEAARRERYRLLFDVANEAGARAVVTAHHEQDQAETVLLHLLRGSGVHGAAGMGERTAAPVGAAARQRDISPKESEPWLWRPLLQESRGVIEAYVTRLGLEWIEDPSNADLGLRRNVVRRRIIPELEAHFAGATAALARYGRLAAADDEALEQIVDAAIAGQVDPGGRLAVAVFAGQPLGVERRIVRRWLMDSTGSSEFSAERCDAVLALVRAGVGNRAIEVGAGWTVRLQGGMLHTGRS